MGAELVASRPAHVVAPVGELDLNSLSAVRRQLLAPPAGCEVVVLDLRGLTFCDTSGIRLVVETMREASARGLAFAVVRGSHAVQHPFATARMEDRLPFFDELGDALGAG